jgi:tRNA(fMet)-specific endonuclease VapC
MSDPTLYLLDTNIVGYVLRGTSPEARQRFEKAVEHSRVAISSVSEAEIRFGLALKPEARRLRTATEHLLESIEILAWDSAAARAYAELQAQLQPAGKALSYPDIFIASHALSLGAVLVSHDRAFRHVKPFLSVEDWAQDLQ